MRLTPLWTDGTLGVVLGPILGVAVQGFVCVLAIQVMDIAVKAGCTTFGELGFLLGGARGRFVLEAAQMMNNVLFLPVALVISSGALQQIMRSIFTCSDDELSGELSGVCSWWDCNIDPLLLTCLLAWPMLLFSRDFEGMSGLAAFSMLLISAQTVIILYYSAKYDAADTPGEHKKAFLLLLIAE